MIDTVVDSFSVDVDQPTRYGIGRPIETTKIDIKDNTLEVHKIVKEKLDTVQLPTSAQERQFYHAPTGRTRKVENVRDTLQRKISQLFTRTESPRRTDTEQIGQLTIDCAEVYNHVESTIVPQARKIMDRLKYLGLNKNLEVSGEGAWLVKTIVKSSEFGHQTSEDRIHSYSTDNGNRIYLGTTPQEAPVIEPINTAVNDQAGQPIPPISDPILTDAIHTLLQDPTIHRVREKYSDKPDHAHIIEWTIQQAIMRNMVPTESTVPEKREIDMKTLMRVKSLSDQDDPEFQSSNPISLWIDPENGRKFVVKQCPEQTLQADYFGLEMLQLAGVPIYEFYFGSVTENGVNKRTLVTGFLEGFQDPAKQLTPDAGQKQGTPDQQAAIRKTLLPERLTNNPHIQQAMLVEILIGEYNTKAHNLMVRNQSVQHLDQGACLTSTASGKFKGFSEEVTIQDVEDVLHCWTDWDHNLQQNVNPAYAAIAEVKDGQLVIHDRAKAEQLLTQLKAIPQQQIDQALESAGFMDGPASLDRIAAWENTIITKLKPDLERKKQQEMVRTGSPTPSGRLQQYERWYNGALETFAKIRSAGGELSYYKKALQTRKSSLLSLWEKAITPT